MSDEEPGYRLTPYEVPDFPRVPRWVDQLRWCIAVMDADDPDLGFAASLLSYAVDKGCLTEKQAKYGQKVVNRIHAHWKADQLDCQQDRPGPDGAEPLTAMQPMGNG